MIRLYCLPAFHLHVAQGSCESNMKAETVYQSSMAKDIKLFVSPMCTYNGHVTATIVQAMIYLNLHNARQKFEWNSTSISLPLSSKCTSQYLIFCSKSNTHPSKSKCALHQPHARYNDTQYTSYTTHYYPCPRRAENESRSS